MRIKRNKIYIGILLICMCALVTTYTYAENKDWKTNNTIKVGFYQYSPYYFINEDGKPDGYYNDLLELISKETKMEYQYIFCDVNNAMSDLKEGKVDLLFGINQTPERMIDFIYSDYYIAIENYSIYTNKEITFGQLQELEGLKFGYIKNEANSEWILDFLKHRNINVNSIDVKSYEEINNLLVSGDVDATVATFSNPTLKDFKTIFNYSAGPVYIAAKKGNEELIKSIDLVFEKYAEYEKNPVTKLHSKYFDKTAQQAKKSLVISALLIMLVSGIVLYVLYTDNIPKIRLAKKQNEIRSNMINNRYLLYYQPIVNPKNNVVKGFEALIRMKNKEQILTPNYFLKEIEDNNMMFEVSLWIIKKAIEEYNIIKTFDSVKDEKFYISVNISFKEIENNEFIEKVKRIAIESKIQPNSICLEIVEKFGMKDINQIQRSIKELKEVGFIVAIDDFGVEYSNLDVLEKLDFSIVKLDKYFIDDIENSQIRKEIVKFLSNLCKLLNKTIVSEGIENQNQMELIKNIDNDKFYIQGYFYSKPLSIEDLKEFDIDKIN